MLLLYIIFLRKKCLQCISGLHLSHGECRSKLRKNRFFFCFYVTIFIYYSICRTKMKLSCDISNNSTLHLSQKKSDFDRERQQQQNTMGLFFNTSKHTLLLYEGILKIYNSLGCFKTQHSRMVDGAGHIDGNFCATRAHQFSK